MGGQGERGGGDRLGVGLGPPPSRGAMATDKKNIYIYISQIIPRLHGDVYIYIYIYIYVSGKFAMDRAKRLPVKNQ